MNTQVFTVFLPLSTSSEYSVGFRTRFRKIFLTVLQFPPRVLLPQGNALIFHLKIKNSNVHEMSFVASIRIVRQTNNDA